MSRTMFELTRVRVASFGRRVEIRQTDGDPRVDSPDASFDRFLTTYVLDLLALDEIHALLREARRVLVPGGLLGITCLTRGEGAAARTVSWIWERIHALQPAWVGGCRPIEVAGLLPAPGWRLLHRSVLAPYAIPSEVVVAERS